MVQHVQLYNGSLSNVVLIFIPTTGAEISVELFVLEGEDSAIYSRDYSD